jgi:hypothetical protein
MTTQPNNSKKYSDDWDAQIEEENTSKPTDIPPFDDEEAPSLSTPIPKSNKADPAKKIEALLLPDEDDDRLLEPIAHWSRPDVFPSLTARSSLFCASRIGTYNTDDSKIETMQLKCQGASLTYSGPRLDMHDKLVWETAVQIAKDRKAPVGTTFVISLRDFASRMGWKNPSGTNLKWIWTSIKRLSRAHLEYKATPKEGRGADEHREATAVEGVGNLIAGAQRRGDSYAIQICEQFSKFAFELDKQFLIQIKRRETLKGLLAKWLHDFLSTHTKEQEFDICYLRELSGFTGRQKDFPVKLNQALVELKTSIPGLVADYEILKKGKSSDDWTVMVHRGDEKPQFVLPRLAPSRIDKQKPPRTRTGNFNNTKKSGVAL